MSSRKRWMRAIGWTVVAGMAGVALAQDATRGYLTAPPGTETLTTELPAVSMQLFSDSNFKGTEATLNGVDTTIQPGELVELPKGLPDSLSSVRWNLPYGVIVVFYEDGAGKGEQMVLWGKGQSSELSKWDFNDKASRWAWYDVGGGVGTSRSELAKLPPNGSKPLDVAIAENSIQLFKNRSFKSDMHQVSPLTAQKAGDLIDIPSNIDDSLTSLKWNLPPGVVVTFYEDASGKKDRVSIWGKGQLSDLGLWDFNDKVSRWSWAYVGAPATDVK